MLHDFGAQYRNIRLRPLAIEDIENLRKWRNDSRNTAFLTKIPYITEDMQRAWYERYIAEQDYFVFAIDEIETFNRMVGSIALYNFKGNVCEYGRFMIGDHDVRGKKAGIHALLLCLHIGFSKMGMEKIIASVHEDNVCARKTDDRAGFVTKGKHAFVRGGYELEIEIDKDRFYQMHPQMKNL